MLQGNWQIQDAIPRIVLWLIVCTSSCDKKNPDRLRTGLKYNVNTIIVLLQFRKPIQQLQNGVNEQQQYIYRYV